MSAERQTTQAQQKASDKSRGNGTEKGADGQKNTATSGKMEERLKILVEDGRRDGYITYDRFNEIFPEDCNSPEKIDEVFAALEAHSIELRDDPVTTVLDTCVGCGLCGEVAHAAVLCPSFSKVDIVRNPNYWDRFKDGIHRRLLGDAAKVEI